jgi:glycosyltransferase involved in cell wall biosynthesis
VLKISSPSTGLLAALPAPASDRSGWPWREETPPSIYGVPPLNGWPKLSIVCPSFQQGRFIEETIRSVLLQNYPNLEFIVMDGGSRDETVGVIERYSSWISHWESQPDRGQSHALNKACARATGEIIGWINSDDYYLPGAFAAVVRAYRTHGPALFYGDDQTREGDAPALVPTRRRQVFRFQITVGGITLPSHATFWPRTAHQRFNEMLRFTMDADFYKRLTAAGLKPRHVRQFLGVFRKHPQAKTATLADVARAETVAWTLAQPARTYWLWRFSCMIERLRGRSAD